MTQVHSSWWSRNLFSSSQDESKPSSTKNVAAIFAVKAAQVYQQLQKHGEIAVDSLEIALDMLDIKNPEHNLILHIIEQDFNGRQFLDSHQFMKFVQFYQEVVAQVPPPSAIAAEDATSSTRGDSTASHSTASCWSSKTPPAEAELPAMTASPAGGSRGTVPATVETEGLGLGTNGIGNLRSKPLLPVPTEVHQDALVLGMAALTASAVLPPPPCAAVPSTPSPAAPPPSPMAMGDDGPAISALQPSSLVEHRHLALPKGEEKRASHGLSKEPSNGLFEESPSKESKFKGSAEAGPSAKLVLHSVMPAPPPSSAALSTAPLPQLHCSEFLQVIIEKQHEVDRFAYASEEDLSTQTLTKMAMMKGELDRLSVSISSILGKSSPNSACVVAPPQGHRQYMDQVLRPAQIWPIVDAVPAPYPTEVDVNDATATAPAGYQSSLVDPPAQAPPLPPPPQSSSSYNPEDHQGPAIFQGFQPPPSYAWGRPPVDGRDAADEPTPVSPRGTSGATASGHGLGQPPPVDPPKSEKGQPSEEAQPSMPQPVRVKSIDMTTPPPGRSGESSMKTALAAAMEELYRCQSKCKLLRTEKRGVPPEEIEAWCGSISKKLQAIGDGLEKKMEAHRIKSRAKDDAIKKLHKRLQAAERAASELFTMPSASPCLNSPPADLRQGLLNHVSSQPQFSPRLSSVSSDVHGADAAGTSPLPHVRTPRVSGPGEPGIMSDSDMTIQLQGNMTEEAAMLTWPPGGESQMLHRARGRFQGGDGETSLARLGIQAVGRDSLDGAASIPQMMQNAGSPSSTATTRASSSTQLGEEKDRSARGHRHVASQKNLGRPATGRGEAQAQQLRRSTTDQVVGGRRRDVDLACQLQAKQQQVDQLQATLRELQLVTSRQIGLYKRQLHLKEHSLQALQEELMLDRGQQGPATAVATPVVQPGNTASAASNSEGTARGTRQHRSQVSSGGGSLVATPAGGLSHSASQRRTGPGGDTTPRPGDQARGRPTHSQNSTWPAPAKKDRERSLGAMPHSPRSKNREVVNQGEGASRRRTSPPGPGPAIGRSTSEERAHRRRDAEPHPHPHPVGHKVYRSRDSGAAMARNRR